jgi:hypothetical protein
MNHHRRRDGIALSVAFVFGVIGCRNHYRPPELPPNQLASVTVDSRATLLSVDGLPPPPEWKRTGLRAGQNEPLLTLPVGTGCRAFVAKYEESFVLVGRKHSRRGEYGATNSLWNLEVNKYETIKPIQFFVPTRAGYTYWLTATFTGDQFLPRVVELAPNGEAVARFLPDVPCQAQ